MTVIVFDGKACAVDSGAVAGTTTHTINKWWVEGNKFITGAGNASHVVAMAEWYKAGAKPEEFPPMVRAMRDAELIVTDTQGVRRYEASPYALDHGLTKCAFGEGRDFAYGALAMGATAPRAAKVACMFSPVCAGPIFTCIWDKAGNIKEIRGV
jgi:hypothetical protein